MKQSGAVSLILTFLIAASAHAVEVRQITRAPFTPQEFDLGLGVGAISANNNLMVVEGNGGLKIGTCGSTCYRNLDFSGLAAARDSQSHYLLAVGHRWQKHWTESSWSPYFRIFGGGAHSIELLEGVRQRAFMGLSLGTYYYLHPKADLRMEFRIAQGQFHFVGLVITSQFKFDETARNYKGITPKGI